MLSTNNVAFACTKLTHAHPIPSPCIAKLKGGGFTDTLSNTWKKVKQFVSKSPLAQKVVGLVPILRYLP